MTRRSARALQPLLARTVFLTLGLVNGGLTAWYGAQGQVGGVLLHLVLTVCFAMMSLAVAWVEGPATSEACCQAVRIARELRRTGQERAYELSYAWELQRLSMAEVEATGLACWAVDLPSELVVSSHGRRGLAAWDLLPGEALATSIRDHQVDGLCWDSVRARVLAQPDRPLVVLGTDFVTSFAAVPVLATTRIVATTLHLGDAVLAQDLACAKTTSCLPH